MNSRERILCSINHKEPDRIPIDLGSTPSSGISAIAYSSLVKYLGIKNTRNRVYDVVQQLAQPEQEILDYFGVDVLDVGRTFNIKDNDWHEIILTNGSRAAYPAWFSPIAQDDGNIVAISKSGEMIGRMPEGATFFDQTVFPYIDGYPEDFKSLSKDMNRVIWSALVHSPWDNASEYGFWTKLRERVLELRKSSDRALMIVCGCNLFEWGTFLRRIDNFLMDIALCPDEVERLLDALMEIHLAILEKVCETVGDVVDIIRFGDDLGTDFGPFMSPEAYRTLFKPRHKMLCDYVKKHSSMYTFLHSCGSIYKLLPDLIEAGYDIINPVQICSRDMDVERLKKEFGRDITFWGGGCDTRSVLNRGTPEQVKEHVMRNIDILATGGGFVFNTVHNILPDVPPENIVAMFEALYH